MCPGLTDIVRVYICLFVWHSTTKACNLHTKHNQLKTIFFLPTGPIVVSCCIDGGEAHSVSGQTTDKQLRPPEEQTIVLVPLVAKSISYNTPHTCTSARPGRQGQKAFDVKISINLVRFRYVVLSKAMVRSSQILTAHSMFVYRVDKHRKQNRKQKTAPFLSPSSEILGNY